MCSKWKCISWSETWVIIFDKLSADFIILSKVGYILKLAASAYLEWLDLDLLGRGLGTHLRQAKCTGSKLRTPPIAEILCVKNGREILVCGFLMK